MHSAFVGMSRTGKTTLAMMIARGLIQRGRVVSVFDPIRDPRWEKTGAVVYTDPFEMLHRCKTTTAGHWFWDEWGAAIKNNADPAIRKLAPAFSWLVTTSRHLGHTQWFIAQSWQDLIHVRAGCDCAYAFGQGHKSAGLVAEDFARPELADELPRFTRGFFKCIVKCDDTPRQGFVDFARRVVRWDVARSTKRKVA